MFGDGNDVRTLVDMQHIDSQCYTPISLNDAGWDICNQTTVTGHLVLSLYSLSFHCCLGRSVDNVGNLDVPPVNPTLLNSTFINCISKVNVGW